MIALLKNNMFQYIGIIIAIVGIIVFAVITIIASQREHKRKMDEIFKNIKKRKVTYYRKDDNTFVRKK